MNRAFAKVVAAVALAVVCGTASAQPESAPDENEWLIQTWQVDEGLPDSSATTMVQTPDGYLWFGTFGGLVRFDGVTFTASDPGNTPQLPSPGIVNIHLDARGWLWISTLEGLVVRAGSRWIDFTNDPVLGDDLIRTFTERANGDLLLTTFNGQVFESDGDTLVPLPPPPGESGKGYWGCVDEDGQWWVVQNQFIGRWDGQQWVRTVPASELADLERENVACTAARDGGLWVLIGADVRRFAHGMEVARRSLATRPIGIWSLCEDSRGNIWMASYRAGVYRLPPNGPPSHWIEFDGMQHGAFRFVFEDREQNLWLGTSGRGLIRLTARRFHDFGTRDTLPASVTSVAPAPGGGLLVGTYGEGLFRLDETGAHAALLPGLEGDACVIQSVLGDSRGRAWVGLYAEGLYMFDGTDGRFMPEGQLTGRNVIALFEDSRGRIWLSGGEQIAVIDEHASRVFGADDGLPVSGVVCFAEDREHVIWLSNLAGVFRVLDDRVVELHDAEGRSISDVACLKSDGDGAMWMGSTTAGLLRWRDGMLAEIGPDRGLPVEGVLGILDDERGRFWMASKRGVVRVSRKELEAAADSPSAQLTCLLFNSKDGLPTMECSGLKQPVCVRDDLGRLWFATVKGVGMADPASFPLNIAPPPVHVEKVLYRPPNRHAGDDGPVDRVVTAPFPSPLELPAGSRGIEIHYTAPSFTAPEKVRFQVRLEDVDPTWRDVGNRRVAFYDAPRAGRYQFRVRAANGDGVWNYDGAGLELVVLPFFWETGWFRALAVMIACAVVLGVVYGLHARDKRQQAMQAAFMHQLISRQEAERSRVASELHDGLGHSLLLIKSRLALLAKGSRPAADTGGQLEELSADVTRTIGEVRSVSRALRPSALAQVGLTHAITWMVEELRTATAIEFETELDNIDAVVAPEMEINLYRIVQEALNNVVKHANASHVSVTVKRSPTIISILVQDNGCGFDLRRLRHEGRPSFGLTGITERAHLLDGRVELASTPGTGTRMTVTVPLPGRST